MSQWEDSVGYIHFTIVHRQSKKSGIGGLLYEKFYSVCITNNRSIVKSCTSPINKLSIQFHLKIDFEIEPGYTIVEIVPVTSNYLGTGNPKVLCRKMLN